jgi:hypothetical protein
VRAIMDWQIASSQYIVKGTLPPSRQRSFLACLTLEDPILLQFILSACA